MSLRLQPGPNIFSAQTVTLSGGSGYVVGEVLTFAVSNTTAIAPVLVEIIAVSSGVPTAAIVIDGGMYNTLLASGAAQAGTTGSGTGTAATFTWKG